MRLPSYELPPNEVRLLSYRGARHPDTVPGLPRTGGRVGTVLTLNFSDGERFHQAEKLRGRTMPTQPRRPLNTWGSWSAHVFAEIKASPCTFVMELAFPLNLVNQPLLASDFSSAASSPVSAFIEFERGRALFWIRFGSVVASLIFYPDHSNFLQISSKTV